MRPWPAAAAVPTAVHPCSSTASRWFFAPAASSVSTASTREFSTATDSAVPAPAAAGATLAPPARSAPIILVSPTCAAHLSAVHPCESTASVGAPAASSAATAPSCAYCTAIISAVPPVVGIAASTFAPAASSASAVGTWPTFAACISGVHSRTWPLTASASTTRSSGATSASPSFVSALIAPTSSAAPSPGRDVAPASSSTPTIERWPRAIAATSSDAASSSEFSSDCRLPARSSVVAFERLLRSTAARRGALAGIV